MKTKEITALAIEIAQKTEEMREHVGDVYFVEFPAMESLETAVDDLQTAILEILENFDEEDSTGFRKPRNGKPKPLYDTLEEKRQALEGP